MSSQADYEVWEEHWPTVEFFLRLRTQWVHGFNGPVGLNYANIQPTLDLLRVELEDKESFFLELQILEDAALETIHSKAR